MRRSARAMIVVAVSTLTGLAACDDPPRLRMDGFGDAVVGMSFAETQQALGPVNLPEGPREACLFAGASRVPGLFVMVDQGTLRRIDIRAGDITTDTGVALGDPAAKVHEVYGTRVEVLPHKYDYASGAEYLTVSSADKRFAVRFITAGGKVARMQAGMSEAVQLVEECG